MSFSLKVKQLNFSRCKKIVKYLALSLLTIVLALVLLLAHSWYFKPLRINWFYDLNFLRQLIYSPTTLTSLRILDDTPYAWYAGQLDDMSTARQDQFYQQMHKENQQLQTYSRDNFTTEQLLNWEIANYQYQQILAGEQFRWHDYPINQLFGLQTQLPNFLVGQHLIENTTQADDYLARLEQFTAAFSDIINDLKVREGKKIYPPRFSVNNSIKQINDFLAFPADKHPLYLDFSEKLQKLKLDQDRSAAYNQRITKALEKSVKPAYQKLLAHMQEVAKLPLSNDGAWRLPDGDKYYQYAIKNHTSSDLSAQEIHQLGLNEVARIGKEMDSILAEQKIPGKNRAEKIANLDRQKEQQYTDDAQGRTAILQDYKKIIDEINQGLGDTFILRPQQGVEVKAVPDISSKTAPGGYYQPPSLDGSRPGTFYANLYKIDNSKKYAMRTLAYHEAVPGHHFQIALQMKLEDLPFFRRAAHFTAYIEGWALYAERLAWELGFQQAPLDNLGRLQAEIFRAVRLVVDSGIHSKKWSREQAITYMMRETGMNEDAVTVEIERYIIDPGQALAYKIGMEKILQLRELAKKQLGDKFKLGEFHRVILQNGALPLALLDKLVIEWIGEQKK